jgi:hypothetical protein
MVRVRHAPWRRAAHDRDGDRGAVAVEFAMLFPLLFFLLFGTLIVGWRIGEAQAGQAAAGEAARLASFGLTDLGSYGHTVTCLGERNGLRRGSLSRLKISFLDPHLTSPAQAAAGGYVTVTLTYRSALGGLPLPGLGDGTLTASAVSRVEQPGSLLTSQVLTLGGGHC